VKVVYLVQDTICGFKASGASVFHTSQIRAVPYVFPNYCNLTSLTCGNLEKPKASTRIYKNVRQ